MRLHETLISERTQVMRDEPLRAPGYPRQVANAQFVGVGKSGREGQPSRVAETARALCRPPELSIAKLHARPDRLRYAEIEAQKLAAVLGRHAVILTAVDAC